MGYTSERNNQMVIGLLKYHGIKKVVASPGATNVSFVASIQQDDFFEIYSSVDERSAAYIACGLSEESGEPVILSCTGATASRNYFPGLTEAYYRKLPVLAITSTMPIGRVGHNIPQVIDRSVVSTDIVKASYQIPMIKDDEDEWLCSVRINEAILELKHNTAGPVHLNLETLQAGTFDVDELPLFRPIDRIENIKSFPKLDKKKIVIFVGTHTRWDKNLTESVDLFCRKYDAVVIGDHTSNYRGAFMISASLITNQKYKNKDITDIDILIYIGNISGSYLGIEPKEVWRVNPDGKICDTYKALRYVFEFDEKTFFEQYNLTKEGNSTVNYKTWEKEYEKLINRIPELPFSNLWIAQKISNTLPKDSILHLGILNSLRSWNFFRIPESVQVYSNTGGFGIDGCISTILGASLAAPEKIIYGVLGDLAFFYDMNALGNRHFPNNVRLLIINNGRGQEFRNYGHRASQFGQDTDKYIAAAGHYGDKSQLLIKNYVENLGFKYLAAANKAEFMSQVHEFLSPVMVNSSIVFEVFTDSSDETEALKRIITIEEQSVGDSAKQLVKNMIGDTGVKTIKKLLKG